jgi:deoxyribonuclease-4
MNDSRFDDVPMILETPKGADCAEDRVNLALLRSLVDGQASPRRPKKAAR